LTFTAAATDVDEPAQTLTFGLGEGTPAGAAVDPDTGEFTWTPTEAQGPSTNSITIEVTDDGEAALSDLVTFEVVVSENDTPISRTLPRFYAPGGSVEVTLIINCGRGDSIVPFEVMETLPEGWSFEEVTSASVEPSKPASGATGTIEFSWLETSSNFVTLTYKVSVPDDENGMQTFNGLMSYYTRGAKHLVPISGNKEIEEYIFHSADTNRDLQIQLMPELKRVVRLYNSDGYHVAPDTDDEYAPGLGSDNGQPHDSDYDPQDWKIQLSPELTRLIQFYNCDGYHHEAETEDGFAPGPEESGNLQMRMSNHETTVEHKFSQDTYPIQGTLEVSVTVDYHGDDITALAFTDEIPEGWNFKAITSMPDPAVSPLSDASGKLKFAWISVPEFPITLSYEVTVPSDASGDEQLIGQLIYRTMGNERHVEVERSFPVPCSDLVVSNPISQAIDAQPGEKLNLDITIENIGTANAVADDESTGWDTTLYLSVDEQFEEDIDWEIAKFALNELAAGTNETRISTFTVPKSPGTYYLAAKVDNLNVIHELDETNNWSEVVILDVKTNNPPVIDPIQDQTIIELTEFNLTTAASDADEPDQTLTFGLGEGAPTGAAVDPSTGEFTWTPTEAQGPSTNSITIEVTDDGEPALSDSVTFEVVVSEVNEAPEVEPVSDQTVDEQTMLTFTAAATDVDEPAQTLTFGLGEGAPTGAAVDPSTGEFTWTPTEVQGPSTNSITIEVTDDGEPVLSDSVTFEVVVSEVNEAPEIEPVADQTVDEETMLTFTVAATDVDEPSQTLTFGLSEGAPTAAVIGPDTGEFTWTPTEAQGPLTNSVTIEVTDDGEPVLTDAVTFDIIVKKSENPILRRLPRYYTPGETVKVGLTINYNNNAIAAPYTITETLPEGWSFKKVISASVEPSKPEPGATGTIEFSWLEASSNHIEITYEVRVPADAQGTNTFNGKEVFYKDGAQRIVTIRGDKEIYELPGHDLKISRSDGIVTVEWGGDYQLETSTSVTGPWRLSDQTSPAIFPIHEHQMMFFKLRIE
ncbi:MAG: putative Ig domain-containing protein, partial [Verrucomicrobia bacterium]|nr:putative Ig domain-containing protein [Verrucomicrobiota bacterium]